MKRSSFSQHAFDLVILAFEVLQSELTFAGAQVKSACSLVKISLVCSGCFGRQRWNKSTKRKKKKKKRVWMVSLRNLSPLGSLDLLVGDLRETFIKSSQT